MAPVQTEKDRDNILPKIMASSDNYDALFQASLPYMLETIVLAVPCVDSQRV